jgi:cellulose 1,4-beta-cellobiosidase
MAFSGLQANQMVSYAEAASSGFTLKSGQTNPGTSQMMTKDMAFTMYNLAANANTNGIAGKQLMQKSFWSTGGDITLPTGATTMVDTNSIRTTTAKLTWSDYADNEGVVGFNIEYFNNSVWALVANVGLITSYNLTGMAPNTGVQYRVRAKDAAGNVSTSGGTAGWTSAINPPTSVTCGNPTSSTVNLTWIKSNGPWPTTNTNATNQHIYVNGALHATISGEVSTYQVTGLSGNTSYSFMVLASGFNNNSGPLSDNSNSTSCDTSSAAPATPTGLFANTLSSSEISTGWNASTGATGYQLYRSNSANGIYDLVIDTTATSHIDSFLGSSNTYYYKIAAYNGSNFSALSNTVSATTSGGGGSQPIQ